MFLSFIGLKIVLAAEEIVDVIFFSCVDVQEMFFGGHSF